MFMTRPFSLSAHFPSLSTFLFDFEIVLSAFADPRISEGGFVGLYLSVLRILDLDTLCRSTRVFLKPDKTILLS